MRDGYLGDNPTRRCRYKSVAWILLIESGWVTLRVEPDGMAVMLSRWAS